MHRGNLVRFSKPNFGSGSTEIFCACSIVGDMLDCLHAVLDTLNLVRVCHVLARIRPLAW